VTGNINNDNVQKLRFSICTQYPNFSTIVGVAYSHNRGSKITRIEPSTKRFEYVYDLTFKGHDIGEFIASCPQSNEKIIKYSYLYYDFYSAYDVDLSEEELRIDFCTNKLDCNQDVIYEGDIVCSVLNGEIQYRVKYGCGEFFLEPLKEFNGEKLSFDNSTDFCIIGNITEGIFDGSWRTA